MNKEDLNLEPYELSQTLVEVLQSLDSKHHESILKQLDDYIKTVKQMNVSSSYIEVAESLNKIVDDFMSKKINDVKVKLDKKISCSKGCDFCCYSEVTITMPEAINMLNYCIDHNIELKTEQLKIQAYKNNFSEIKYADRRCTFLDENGSCKVYEVRPNSCRKHLVTTPANDCNQEKNIGGEVERVISLETELISSATFNVFESDRLSILILRSMGDAS